MGVIFSLAPRASISGNLLALSDFYWPRANGPVLVSTPGLLITNAVLTLGSCKHGKRIVTHQAYALSSRQTRLVEQRALLLSQSCRR